MGLVKYCEIAAMVGAVLVFLLHAWNVQPQVRPQLVGLGLALLTVGLILAGIGR